MEEDEKGKKEIYEVCKERRREREDMTGWEEGEGYELEEGGEGEGGEEEWVKEVKKEEIKDESEESGGRREGKRIKVQEVKWSGTSWYECEKRDNASGCK